MKLFLPLFLLVISAIVMWQPRTKRWQDRIRTHFGGNEQRMKQRANTFFLLGFAFFLGGLAMLYRVTTE